MIDERGVASAVSADSSSEPSRRIVLFGARSLYQDAIISLIENRAAGKKVVQADDDSSLAAGTVVDLAVVDFSVERATAEDVRRLTEMIRRIAPSPVLLICERLDPPLLQSLLRDGVAGIVTRSCSGDTLIEAIESVASGKVWLQRDLLTETFGDSSHVRRVCSEEKRIGQLTQRERELIHVACSGMTNRQVAKRLQISEATVRHHLSSIFSKLGASNRAELIVFAYRHGLADEADRRRLC